MSLMTTLALRSYQGIDVVPTSLMPESWLRNQCHWPYLSH